MHEPVLLQEVLEYLDPRPGKCIVDGTINGGGHTREILKKISPQGTLLGIDWDEELITHLRRELKRENAHLFLTHGNYADLLSILKKQGIGKVDGILLDLGFSSFHTDRSGRGFTFDAKGDKEEPLLMTYDEKTPPLHSVLPRLGEKELKGIIGEFGGERYAGRVAKAIKEESRRRKILTNHQLAEVVRNALPRGYEKGRLDPATRTFQALRIYVNHELENLKKFLTSFVEVLAPGGRVVIISFHSLEDQLVKQHFAELKREKEMELLTPKPIEASLKERLSNPRSRSAKLRAILKKD